MDFQRTAESVGGIYIESVMTQGEGVAVNEGDVQMNEGAGSRNLQVGGSNSNTDSSPSTAIFVKEMHCKGRAVGINKASVQMNDGDEQVNVQMTTDSASNQSSRGAGSLTVVGEMTTEGGGVGINYGQVQHNRGDHQRNLQSGFVGMPERAATSRSPVVVEELDTEAGVEVSRGSVQRVNDSSVASRTAVDEPAFALPAGLRGVVVGNIKATSRSVGINFGNIQQNEGRGQINIQGAGAKGVSISKSRKRVSKSRKSRLKLTARMRVDGRVYATWRCERHEENR